MAFIYTYDDLQALAAKFQCCYADIARKALESEMFNRLDTSCFYDKGLYMHRVTDIISNFMPDGTVESYTVNATATLDVSAVDPLLFTDGMRITISTDYAASTVLLADFTSDLDGEPLATFITEVVDAINNGGSGFSAVDSGGNIITVTAPTTAPSLPVGTDITITFAPYWAFIDEQDITLTGDIADTYYINLAASITYDESRFYGVPSGTVYVESDNLLYVPIGARPKPKSGTKNLDGVAKLSSGHTFTFPLGLNEATYNVGQRGQLYHDDGVLITSWEVEVDSAYDAGTGAISFKGIGNILQASATNISDINSYLPIGNYSSTVVNVVGAGAYTWFIEPGAAYVGGEAVAICPAGAVFPHYGTNPVLNGTVTAYNAGTGQLDITIASGSYSFSNTRIYPNTGFATMPVLGNVSWRFFPGLMRTGYENIMGPGVVLVYEWNEGTQNLDYVDALVVPRGGLSISPTSGYRMYYNKNLRRIYFTGGQGLGGGSVSYVDLDIDPFTIAADKVSYEPTVLNMQYNIDICGNHGFNSASGSLVASGNLNILIGNDLTADSGAYIEFWGKLATTTNSLTIGVGVQNFTLPAGLSSSVVAGSLYSLVYDVQNHMNGTLVSYDNITGATVLNVTSVVGAGTYALWEFSFNYGTYGPMVAKSFDKFGYMYVQRYNAGYPTGVRNQVWRLNNIETSDSTLQKSMEKAFTFPDITTTFYTRGVYSDLNNRMYWVITEGGVNKLVSYDITLGTEAQRTASRKTYTLPSGASNITGAQILYHTGHEMFTIIANSGAVLLLFDLTIDDFLPTVLNETLATLNYIASNEYTDSDTTNDRMFVNGVSTSFSATPPNKLFTLGLIQDSQNVTGNFSGTITENLFDGDRNCLTNDQIQNLIEQASRFCCLTCKSDADITRDI